MILTRIGIEAKDRLRHSPALRNGLAFFLSRRLPGRATVQPQEHARAIVRLCRAARMTGSGRRLVEIERSIRERIAMIAGRNIDWSEFEGQWKRDRIETGVVLKPYVGPKERGVLLVSFEYQWSRLAQIADLQSLASRYALVLAPSWSPPHSLETCLFPALYPGRIISLISHADDVLILPRLAPNVTALPLYASSWVDPGLYHPRPFAQRDIDLVMVANFSQYKRHFALFRALRDMPRSVSVLLAGRPLAGRTAAVLRTEAAAYGVADRFELMENASDQELADALARSKVSVILSRQEGSCVAVVESLFAGTPVGLYSDARIGSRAFINPSTGRFLERQGLASQLLDFIAKADRYTPRRWALEHRLSCFDSTASLNQALKQQALAAGEMWTVDIAAHHWRPNPELASPADRDRLQPASEDIRVRYGFELGTR